MFVVSVNSHIMKKVAIIVLTCTVVAGVSGVAIHQCLNTREIETNRKLAVNNSASDIEELLKFVSGFGWDINNEPDDVREIIIPSEFDDVYEKYNQLQLSQGYNLEPFAGQRVKKWCFTVNNYDGYEDTDYIKINILVRNGQVIGGDVCSVKLDGFMHGFSKDT